MHSKSTINFKCKVVLFLCEYWVNKLRRYLESYFMEIANKKSVYQDIYVISLSTRCIKTIVGFYNIPDTDTDTEYQTL
jgi:hypothetical protein